jgi:hypothetical protein
LSENILVIDTLKLSDDFETVEEDDFTRREKLIIKDAIEKCKNHLNDNSFSTKYKYSDTITEVEFEINYGHIFSSKFKHLVIKREGIDAINTYIYLFKNNTLNSVVKYYASSMTSQNDSIQDVNGDNDKDFVANWYGSSGCCLKDFYDVYILNPQNGTFSNQFRFINPTFSPKEHIIRGVEYGQPGETDLYKYKWNGLKVDTIEYIHPYDSQKNCYSKSVFNPQNRKFEKVKLDSLPSEYSTINDYDWFILEKFD